MIKKILSLIAFVASVAACTDDYKDWVSPQVVPQPEPVAFSDGSVSTVGVIDLNNEHEALVKVCDINPPTSTNENYVPYYEITLDDVATYSITVEGKMSAAELQNYVASKYGRRPIEREVGATLSMWLGNGTTTVKTATSDVFTITVIPQAPNIESAYFLTGSINGWDNTNKTYKLTNDGSDPYENPVYKLLVPATEDGSDIEFKMTPESGIGGDWSGCLAAAEEEGKFNYDNVGGNFKIEAVEGAIFYDLTFNMLDQTWTVKPLAFTEYIYEAGVNNDWGAKEQPLYSANQDGKYLGYFYAQDADWSGGKGAFKFQKNFNDWDTNWGYGSGDDTQGTLAEGGDNIMVTPGFYRAEIDVAGLTYKLTPISSIGVIGPAQPGGWDTDTDMTYNPETMAWEITIDLAADQFKFRANDGWDINWGGTVDNLTEGGDNLSIAEAGKYFIQLFPLCQTKAYCTITKK